MLSLVWSQCSVTRLMARRTWSVPHRCGFFTAARLRFLPDPVWVLRSSLLLPSPSSSSSSSPTPSLPSSSSSSSSSTSRCFFLRCGPAHASSLIGSHRKALGSGTWRLLDARSSFC
ncbi:uncharacterized protein EKO05_0007132 [Ascochyta rabiei]|uniref:uncharacterized protein n=1 Tax=Didymella rabiei TaxID=5454 RepID=UPI00220BC118|nr:uncharacterized protein EKO05_0007132 [Ascochyta rabiei]UPX16745.1 hypothetical protein EKO05_0007132 [Ascochyta rabiei]